jgi:hypothetical protein
MEPRTAGEAQAPQVDCPLPPPSGHCYVELNEVFDMFIYMIYATMAYHQQFVGCWGPNRRHAVLVFHLKINIENRKAETYTCLL